MNYGLSSLYYRGVQLLVGGREHGRAPDRGCARWLGVGVDDVRSFAGRHRAHRGLLPLPEPAEEEHRHRPRGVDLTLLAASKEVAR